MKTRVLLIGFLLFASLAWTQHAGYNPGFTNREQPSRPSTGPSEFDVAKVEKDASSPIPSLQRADLVKLRQDADELATLAHSIPPDVDQTTKGTLPKDLNERLRKIEKLAKHLRSQITP